MTLLTDIPARQRPHKFRRSQEVDALIGRMFAGGASHAKMRQVAQIGQHVRFGISSSALVEHAVLGTEVPAIDCPYDWDDLERCEIVHAIAPRMLATLMTPTLLLFRQAVAKRAAKWDDLRPKPDQFWSWRLPPMEDQ